MNTFNKKIVVTFTDESGNAVTPTSVMWILSDSQGNIVNERENVEIDPVGASATIVLSGEDLVLSDAYLGTMRVLTVKMVYASDISEEELEHNAEDTFRIIPLVNVT